MDNFKWSVTCRKSRSKSQTILVKGQKSHRRVQLFFFSLAQHRSFLSFYIHILASDLTVRVDTFWHTANYYAIPRSFVCGGRQAQPTFPCTDHPEFDFLSNSFQGYSVNEKHHQQSVIFELINNDLLLVV